MANIWQCQELPFATDNFHIRLAFLSYSDSFNRNSNIWSTEFSTFGSWIYPQKLTHVRHLAIKILLNAKKKTLRRIKIQVGHPIKTVLKIVSFSVGKWQIEMLLFSNVIETSSYQVFIDIDNLWTRFSTIGERGCAAIDQIQTGHSISIGQFNSSCRWMKC